MRTDILPEHLRAIIAEMCKRVGANAKIIDVKKENWFMKYEWTQEEEEDFRVWLGKFLVKNKYIGKGTYRGIDWGYYEAGKFVENYGWKISDW